MPVKSVVEIEVNSKEFERYKTLFDSYHEKLSKMPSSWAKVGKEQKSIASGFEKVAAGMLAQNQLSREMGKAHEAQAKHLTQSEKLWASMAKSTKSVASNIIGATRSLLHWTKILTEIGGLFGAGSLWGIDRIAANVANQRRSALGLGTSIGGQKAFQTYFERFVDPDSFLGKVSEMEGNPAEAWRMSTLGITPSGSTEKDAPRLLRAMRARALMTPANQLGFLDQTTGMGVGVETWRRLHDSTQAEFEQMMQQNAANAAAMNVPNALNWQNLKTTFSGNWGKVSSAFDTRLGELAPVIGKLSDSFTKLALSLINSPAVEKGLTTVGVWLGKLNDIVGAPDFQSKFEAFIDKFGKGVGEFVDGIEKTADAIQSIAAFLKDPLGHNSAPVKATKSRFLTQLDTLEENSGLPKGLLAFQWGKESGQRLNPADSAKGAVGAFQIKPDTAAWLNKMHHTHLDPRKPGEASLLADYYDEWAMARYHGDVQKVLASYNYGSGNLDALLAKHPKDWRRHLPAETRDYITGAPGVTGSGQINLSGVSINVNVSAPPGHSATISAAQLAR